MSSRIGTLWVIKLSKISIIFYNSTPIIILLTLALVPNFVFRISLLFSELNLISPQYTLAPTKTIDSGIGYYMVELDHMALCQLTGRNSKFSVLAFLAENNTLWLYLSSIQIWQGFLVFFIKK